MYKVRMGVKDRCVICGKHDEELCFAIKVIGSKKRSGAITEYNNACIHVGCLDLRYSLKKKRIFQKVKYQIKEEKIRDGLPKECYACKYPMSPEDRYKRDSFCGCCAILTGRKELFNHPIFIKHRHLYE